ncbi:MAG: hypothetical protein IPK60_03975 [Sandaracinaceae bacterium]|nr:hypothetical protein [Sandaracinaceae bacterium]
MILAMLHAPTSRVWILVTAILAVANGACLGGAQPEPPTGIWTPDAGSAFADSGTFPPPGDAGQDASGFADAGVPDQLPWDESDYAATSPFGGADRNPASFINTHPSVSFPPPADGGIASDAAMETP